MNVIPTEIKYQGRKYRLVEEWSSQKFGPAHYIPGPTVFPTVVYSPPAHHTGASDDLRFQNTCTLSSGKHN